MRVNALIVTLILLSGAVSAFEEILFKGGVDFALGKCSEVITEVVKIIGDGLSSHPNFDDWPTFNELRKSLNWLSGIFIIALTLQGIKYIISAESPASRAKAKLSVQKLFIGMIIVAVSDELFRYGLSISNALTNNLIEIEGYQVGAEKIGLVLSSLSLACVFTPITSIILLALFIVYVGRNILILILWVFFPLILTLYFSQIGMLTRLGSKGINLYITVVFSGPIMGLLFRVSLMLMSGQSGPALDNLVSTTMALATFLLAALSPLFLFGLMDKIGAITGMIGSVGGAIVGGALTGGIGAIAGGLAGSAAKLTQSNSKDLGIGDTQPSTSIKNGLEDRGKETDDELKKEEKEEEEQSGKVPYACPHGRGKGDEVCIRQARMAGAFEKGSVVLENPKTANMRHNGKNYQVHVAEHASGGFFQVVTESEGHTSYYNVPKTRGVMSSEDIIDMIREQKRGKAGTLHKVVKNM